MTTLVSSTSNDLKFPKSTNTTDNIFDLPESDLICIQDHDLLISHCCRYDIAGVNHWTQEIEFERMFGYEFHPFCLQTIHNNKKYTNLIVGSIDKSYCTTAQIGSMSNFFRDRKNVVKMLEKNLGIFGFFNNFSEPSIPNCSSEMLKKLLTAYNQIFPGNYIKDTTNNVSILQIGTIKINGYHFQQLFVNNHNDQTTKIVESKIDFNLFNNCLEYKKNVINFVLTTTDDEDTEYASYINPNSFKLNVIPLASASESYLLN